MLALMVSIGWFEYNSKWGRKYTDTRTHNPPYLSLFFSLSLSHYYCISLYIYISICKCVYVYLVTKGAILKELREHTWLRTLGRVQCI